MHVQRTHPDARAQKYERGQCPWQDHKSLRQRDKIHVRVKKLI